MSVLTFDPQVFSLDYCHSDDNIGSLIYTQLNDEHGFV